jgi:eukaryotic-like serine/threonine-protein kinase
MICSRCGKEIALGSRFCGNCGTQGSDPEAGTVVLAPEDSEVLLARLRLVFGGEFDVERELGRGGMAAVFKAVEIPLRRQVALKVLLPEMGIAAATVERFKREASLVAGLDHPNVVPIYRVGLVGGVFHIAMRFVDGRSLHSILEAQGALPLPAVLAVLRGATRGLAFAHDRGVVHRDVKGGNILVDTDGRVLISDFGIALRATDASITAVGTVIGTPSFMSPEQCAGHRAVPQSDQYSLGIVAFQMLTGSVPFESEGLAGLMQHHFFTPVPDIRLVRDDVPEALVAWIERAMTKAPDQRFPRTREMLAALEAIPFPEADRREAERILCELASGTAVPKLSTRSLPVLAAAPTLPFAPALAGRRWWRSPGWIAGAAAAAVLALVLAVQAARTGEGRRAAVLRPPETLPVKALPESPAASVTRPPQAPQPPPPAATGKLRLLTVPPVAEILLDGRPVGVGSVFDLKLGIGPRRLEIRATGYQTFDTTIMVRDGETLSLGRIALRNREGAVP